MRRILYVMFELGTAGVFLIPVFWLLNHFVFKNGRRTAAYLVLALYISAVWVLVGMPNAGYLRLELNLQLIPLVPMLTDLKNTILNLALFVPLGILLPILWKPFRDPKKTLGFGFGVSLLIELAQIFTFRATDINDLIANTLGTLLGWVIGSFTVKKTNRRPIGKTKDMMPVLVSTIAVMFFLYPLLAEKAFLLLF